VSTIEERLARDIAAVTGGITVTDQDMRQGRTAVAEGVRSRRRRDVRVVVAAAAVAAVVVGAAGWQVLGDGQDANPEPAPPGPSPTASESTHTDRTAVEEAFLVGDAPTLEAVEGVWRLDNGQLLMAFGADGVVRMDKTGRTFSQQAALVGTYSLDNDSITLEVTDGTYGCAGQSIVMAASVPEPGLLRLLHTEPGTDNCTPEQNGQWVMEQLLPRTNPGLAGVGLNGANRRPPSGMQDLVGDWFQQGGGEHLLEVLPEGRYLVLGGLGDVVDQGRWSTNDSLTRMTFESGSDSATCSTGDRLVLASLGSLDNGATFLSGTLVQDDCAGGWAREKWIRLAHP
jgi:hypothetical protein